MNCASCCANRARAVLKSAPRPVLARRRARLRRRGVAAVEFAVVAPVFFLFTMGVVEVGRLMMVQQVLTTASREGARNGILEGSSAASVQASVTSYLAKASIAGATTTVTPASLDTAQPGEPVTVTVQVPYNDVSWVPSSWFFDSVSLSASTHMRREGLR